MRLQLTAVPAGLVLRHVKGDPSLGLIDIVEFWHGGEGEWDAPAARHAVRYGDARLQQWLVAAARSLRRLGSEQRIGFGEPDFASRLLTCIARLDAATDAVEAAVAFHDALPHLGSVAALYLDHRPGQDADAVTRWIVDDRNDLLASLRSRLLIGGSLRAVGQTSSPDLVRTLGRDVWGDLPPDSTFVIPIPASDALSRVGVMFLRASEPTDPDRGASMRHAQAVWARSLALAIHAWSERTAMRL